MVMFVGSLCLVLALAQAASALPGKRGACVVQCVSATGQYQDMGLPDCPPDHECRNTGCGSMCLPTNRDTHAKTNGPSKKIILVAGQHIKDVRGSCLMLCGSTINKACGLNGYDCASNGCGTECKLRTDYIQPLHCPVFSCDLHCPTGFYRDDRGCDQCHCAYTIVDKN